MKESTANPEEPNQAGNTKHTLNTQSNIRLIEDIAGSVLIHAPFVHTSLSVLS